MTKIIEIKKRKRHVAKRFGIWYYVCHRRFGKGFAFHHKLYCTGEKKYSDFMTNYFYQKYILDIIEKRPGDFALLCQNHHRAVEILKVMKPDRFERFVNLVVESRP